MFKRFTYLLLYFAPVLLILASGCGESTPLPVATPTTEAVPVFATTGGGLEGSPSRQVPHLFGGSGDKVSDPFSLSKGTARITLTHVGKLNFIVELLNSDGTVAELLVDQVGPYNGSAEVNIPAPATYILKVRADGEWVISIEQ